MALPEGGLLIELIWPGLLVRIIQKIPNFYVNTDGPEGIKFVLLQKYNCLYEVLNLPLNSW
jgi:hypothetical protein